LRAIGRKLETALGTVSVWGVRNITGRQ